MEEQKTEDYKERLHKARQKRNGKDPMHWFMVGGCAVIVVLIVVIIVKLAQGGTFGGSGNARVASASEAEVQETVIGETLPEDEEQAKEDEEKKNVVESYQNLGIVDVSCFTVYFCRGQSRESFSFAVRRQVICQPGRRRIGK